MKTVLKFAPWILSIALFLIGRLTAPSADVDVKAWEKERESLYQLLAADQAKLDAKDSHIRTIETKMYLDSVESAAALKANNEAFLKLKRENEKLNFSRATTAELDSLRAGIISLYSARGK